jgi:hypothetical protein
MFIQEEIKVLNLDKRFRFSHDEIEVLPRGRGLAPKYDFFASQSNLAKKYRGFFEI